MKKESAKSRKTWEESFASPRKVKLTLVKAKPMSGDAERQFNAVIDALIQNWIRMRQQPQGDNHVQSTIL